MTKPERTPSAHVQRKRALARDRIVEAAIREFAARGYEATTMSDVAAALNMTSAALYYYFKAKDDLLFAALETILSNLLERLCVAAHEILDPIERLKAIVAEQVTFELEVLEAAPLVNAHLYGPRYLVDALDLSKKKLLRDQQRRIVDLYKTAIEDGVRSGAFAVDDTQACALDILAISQYPAVWFKPGRGVNVRDIARRQADVALKLLICPSAAV